MEKNYINYLGNTCFYADMVDKEYGIKVSIEDTDKAEEIIREGLEKNKESIEAWKKLWEEGVA